MHNTLLPKNETLSTSDWSRSALVRDFFYVAGTLPAVGVTPRVEIIDTMQWLDLLLGRRWPRSHQCGTVVKVGRHVALPRLRPPPRVVAC